MSRKHYTLTTKAANDLRAAKAWSLSRWNKALTDEYFEDLHKEAQYIAEHHKSFRSRNELDRGYWFVNLSSSGTLDCLPACRR